MFVPDGDYGTTIIWADSNRVQFTHGIKDFALTGWMALVVGVALVAFGVYAPASIIAKLDLHRAVPIAMGAFFLVVGAHLSLWRTGVVIDRDQGLVSRWWGLLTPLWSKDHRLDGFNRLLVRRQEPSWRSSPGCADAWVRGPDVHPVHLAGPGGSVELTRAATRDDAQLLAHDLAEWLGVEYHAVPEAPEAGASPA